MTTNTPPQQATPAAGELDAEIVKHILRTTPGPDGYRAALVQAGYAYGLRFATPAASPIVAAQPELTDAEIDAAFFKVDPFWHEKTAPINARLFARGIERKVRTALATRGAAE